MNKLFPVPGSAPLRKIIPVVLGNVTVGGGLTTAIVGVRLNNPTGKLRFSIEVGGDDSAAIVALSPNSIWAGRAVVNGTVPPTAIFLGQSLPDSFEAVTAGRQFFFSIFISALAVAAAGQANVIATCTWEPVDSTMSDEERAYWFTLCSAKVELGPVALRTA